MVRVFAPFTPFLTEYMYQNLRHLVQGEVQDSVHYVMIPDARKDLIDVGMERAVARFVAELAVAKYAVGVVLSLIGQVTKELR